MTNEAGLEFEGLENEINAETTLVFAMPTNVILLKNLDYPNKLPNYFAYDYSVFPEKETEYTLVHDNPEYYVIPKSAIDGDVMGALQAIEYCLNILENSKIYDEDFGIWSSGSSSNPRITSKTLKVLRNALIARSDPDTIVIKRSEVQGIEDEFKSHDWYKHGQSLEKCMISMEVLNIINERKAKLIDKAMKERVK